MPYFYGIDQSHLHLGTQSSLKDGTVYDIFNMNILNVIQATMTVIKLEILTADTTMVIS